MGNDLGFGAIWALGGVIITALFAWLTQKNKGRVEESVSVRGEWEKLTTSLSARLTSVEKDFAEYRNLMSKEFDALRKNHREEIDGMRDHHRTEMREMRRLNEGLQRMIAQNSQSAAFQLNDKPMAQELNQTFPPVADDEDKFDV